MLSALACQYSTPDSGSVALISTVTLYYLHRSLLSAWALIVNLDTTVDQRGTGVTGDRDVVRDRSADVLALSITQQRQLEVAGSLVKRCPARRCQVPFKLAYLPR